MDERTRRLQARFEHRVSSEDAQHAERMNPMVAFVAKFCHNFGRLKEQRSEPS